MVNSSAKECEHKQCVPKYDREAAATMSVKEVCAAFPRFSGVCPDCHQRVIVYACFEQYIQGDY